MAKSAWRKQQDANAKADQLLASSAAAGKTLNTSRPNPNRPNPVPQGTMAREKLTNRYHEIGAGRNVRALTKTDKYGAVNPVTGTQLSGQESTPGVRAGAGVIASIGDRPRASYSNTASTVRLPQALNRNTGDQDRARQAVRGERKTVDNRSTVFQEGLRKALTKR